MPREPGGQGYPAEQESVTSIIGERLRIKGVLKSAGHVHIDGAVNGDLHAASVVVGEKGSIEGNVAADTIEVHGFVSGNIKARVVEFGATAHFVGDTAHEELLVETGACLDGNFQNTGHG